MDEQNTQQQPVSQPAPAPAPTQPAVNPAPNTGKPQQNTAMAVVAYILFFVPLLTDAKNDPFVKFHVKQGLILFILSVLVYVIGMVLPWYMWWRISSLLNLGFLILFILGIMNVVNGKMEKLPLVGQFADKFNF